MGSVDSVPRGLGFDTRSVVSCSVAQAMYGQGYRFCMRYVGLLTNGSSDLSPGEVQDILAAKLCLSVVQHATTSKLTASLGTENGSNAATNAAAVGIPSGVTLWCDIEEVASGSATVDYINAWAAAVVKACYVPGLYVGPGSGLSSSTLYRDLSVAHYWKSASLVPWVEVRGFQMIQGLSFKTPQGLSIDPDVACFDAKGDLFTVLHPSSS